MIGDIQYLVIFKVDLEGGFMKLLIELIYMIIIVLVIIISRKKYKNIINNYDIKFYIKEYSKLYTVLNIIIITSIVSDLYFNRSDNSFIWIMMYGYLPINNYANKFIVYSGGIYMMGKSYLIKDILSYQVMETLKNYTRFRILINENNRKIYKSVQIKNKYKDNVIKALEELI